MSSSVEIESIKVRNFRMLRDVELKRLTPLTVLVGPNGSGKSTILDVFAFLFDCFEWGLHHAWDQRGGMRDIRSRDASGPIQIDIRYREKPNQRLIAYHLSIDEIDNQPVVVKEWMHWKTNSYGGPFRFLNFKDGKGSVAGGMMPKKGSEKKTLFLASRDVIAASALGRIPNYPRVSALRDFILGWQFANISPERCWGRRIPRSQRKIGRTGYNLANVVKYFSEKHPDKLEEIFQILRKRFPSFDKATVDEEDGRISLKIKDSAFDDPFYAKYSSEGILKMLAYLIGLKSPLSPTLFAVEEPENYVYPRLFHLLVDEMIEASNNMHVIVATHSPFFLDSRRPHDVRMVWRDQSGFTNVERISDSVRIMSFLNAGGRLGDLWMEGQFSAAEPPRREGAPLYRRAMG